ncbi:IS110 family transposase [Halobacillus fulvus]|nr:IS110 family transposase [Halobacillus fulvus]
MNSTLKFVGLDVSKAKIAVAVADEGYDAPRYWGTLPHTMDAIRSLVKKLGDPECLRVCYEAGPTGYPLYRFLRAMDIHCDVIAPSLIPQRPGERIKTDRRDAVRLAQLYRSGELTSIRVPTEDDEALRDLIRCREDAVGDELRAKHRLTKFFLRHNICPPAGVKFQSKKYQEWLNTVSFERSTSQLVFQEYLYQWKEIRERIGRLDAEIRIQASEGPHAPLIQALQGLRGIGELTATSLVAEIGSFIRFPKPTHLMSFAGMVPSESSSGDYRRQGSITKAGNRHVRRLIIESAWSYKYKPAVKGELKKRLKGLPPEIHLISWKAQNRLHKKLHRLLSRGVMPGKAITAVAREFLGFIWAVALEVENVQSTH